LKFVFIKAVLQLLGRCI